MSNEEDDRRKHEKEILKIIEDSANLELLKLADQFLDKEAELKQEVNKVKTESYGKDTEIHDLRLELEKAKKRLADVIRIKEEAPKIIENAKRNRENLMREKGISENPV